MNAPCKEYNPHWPFPQYDEQGRQLLPANWNQRQTKHQADLSGLEEAPF